MIDTAELPRARELASNALSEAGLEELFAPGGARHLVEMALCPDVGDGSLLNPRRFQRALESVIDDTEDETDPDIRAMIDRELVPLRQNKALLNAYIGLMIGG